MTEKQALALLRSIKSGDTAINLYQALILLFDAARVYNVGVELSYNNGLFLHPVGHEDGKPVWADEPELDESQRGYTFEIGGYAIKNKEGGPKYYEELSVAAGKALMVLLEVLEERDSD